MVDRHLPSGGSSMRQRMESTRKWASTTPGRLRLFSIEIAVVVVALIAIGSGTAAAALVTVNGMQQQTVPMIVEMQHIHAWLADADRSAASAYLAGRFDSGQTQVQFDAEATATGLDLLGRLNPDDPRVRYQADIAAVNRELQHATEQTQEGDEANQRLHTLAVAVANYTRQIDTAATTGGADQAAGTVYLQGGSNLMHGRGGILAQVDALRSLYAANLQRANITLQITAGMAVLYVAVAIWLLVLLIRTQRFVTARFRRRRNSRLVAATLVLVAVLLGSTLGAVQAGESVHNAQDESLADMMSLWDARSLAYAANTDASMTLILPNRIADYTPSFQSETGQLVDRPLTDAMVQQAAQGDVSFGGLLASQLLSASTATERESAMHTLRAYQQFMQVSTQATQQADASAKAQAADAAARARNGSRPSPSPSPSASPSTTQSTAQSAAAPRPVSDDALVASVDELDWYLGASLQIRQGQFDATMESAGFVLLVTLVLVTLTVAVAGLTFWGVKPRLDEYTV
jgi:hypothetical protein